MTEEGAQEILTVLNAEGCTASAVRQGVQVGGGIVGEAIGFEVGPDIFDGIELGGIRGEVDQVRRARQDTLPDGFAFMSLEAVPDEHDWSAQLSLQLLEEDERALAVDVGIRVETKVKREAVPGGRNAQRGDGRDLPMRAGSLMQHRGIPERAPGAAHQGRQQQARFVDEDDAGPQARSVFFTRGQSCLIQAWMRCSSRSAARRVGFWGEKPNPCSRRLTCAG